MSGGHAEQGPVGMPELQGLPDSLAWIAPSSGQTKYTQLKDPQLMSECFRAKRIYILYQLITLKGNVQKIL